MGQTLRWEIDVPDFQITKKSLCVIFRFLPMLANWIALADPDPSGS